MSCRLVLEQQQILLKLVPKLIGMPTNTRLRRLGLCLIRMRESRSFKNLDSFGFCDEMVDGKKEAHGRPTSAVTKSSLLRRGRLPLSQEGGFVFRVGSKRHAVPLGDPFTNLGVVVAVELDEI